MEKSEKSRLEHNSNKKKKERKIEEKTRANKRK